MVLKNNTIPHKAQNRAKISCPHPLEEGIEVPLLFGFDIWIFVFINSPPKAD